MDPISDMLTRIRNAVAVNKAEVVIPFSKIKFGIAKILENEKFIDGVEVMEAEKQFKIFLKYDASGKPVIRSIKRISKLGNRVYVPKDKLPKVLGGQGIAVVSTSRGLLTDREARKVGLGGEVICGVF